MPNMQASDGLALELSDIMHTMSPSPIPQLSLPPDAMHFGSPHMPPPEPIYALEPSAFILTHIRHARVPSPSPEPLDRSEIQMMRSRIEQLGFAGPSPGNSGATSIEHELADMVLRLTTHPILKPSTSQLAVQAETIADLTEQRNQILQEREEEHARWQAEREGWERSAEALIGKRRAATDAAEKDYESERLISRLRDDNWALRHKLSDANSRLAALEHELSRLRPLLLMQPSILNDPSLLQHPAFAQLAVVKDNTENRRKKLKKERERAKDLEALKEASQLQQQRQRQEAEGQAYAEAEFLNDMEMDAPVFEANGSNELLNGQASNFPMDVIAPAATIFTDAPASQGVAGQSTGPPPEAATSSKQYHVQILEKPQKKRKEKERRFRRERAPLLSDARAECLLVAARKIGRMRAILLAEMVREREERERQQNLGMSSFGGPSQYPLNGWQFGMNGQPGPSSFSGFSPFMPVVSGNPLSAQNSFSSMSFPHAPPFQTALQTPPMHHMQPQPLAGPPQSYPISAPGFLYVPNPISSPAASGTQTVPSTPTALHSQTSSHTQFSMGGRSQEEPTTPLHSLLTAARTLLVGEDFDVDEIVGVGGEATEHRVQTRSAATAALEPSTPKKRRALGRNATLPVAAPSPGAAVRKRRPVRAAATDQPPNRKGKGKQKEGARDTNGHAGAPTSVRLTRVHSALDVLAQAADEQERRPPSGPASRRGSVEPERRSVVPLSRLKHVETGDAARSGTSVPGATSIVAEDDDSRTQPSSPRSPTQADPVGRPHTLSHAAHGEPAKRPPSVPPVRIEPPVLPDNASVAPDSSWSTRTRQIEVILVDHPPQGESQANSALFGVSEDSFASSVDMQLQTLQGGPSQAPS
ncbi:uncharacterized protein LAESUDRAFT_725993 [Laetiporus sulphureus 93-53]|uniref:Uncharacterized protein n=1 Tax=Laetiporus sulphureus 93-53 TaxID=1314785 RepID=A0A165E9N6_9APHY|nr:uncharacterized protein LAESUDRAFT_725993 [Laetiporus sulphureus 93-53]KZT06539.1 hypothetical protein LAESUDRAFT_725993 [Laetiporus sulphureus 93-53]